VVANDTTAARRNASSSFCAVHPPDTVNNDNRPDAVSRHIYCLRISVCLNNNDPSPSHASPCDTPKAS
jgi:hypothetical protein